MLMISLADNRRIVVRPSGTKPKIKYYLSRANLSPKARRSLRMNSCP